MSTTAPQARHTVTALIVAHDGARLLPGLVQALAAQTYQVEQTVGVDTGSRDRSGAVLAELIGQDAVFGMNRSTGYGEAVSVALRHATRRRSGTTDPGVARVEWLWLLHDDCEPAPDALEKLLRAASKDRTVVVVGPKVLDGQDRRTLCEVGVSIDRASRRVTGIDPGEIDQGQHDHKRAVLAVGSAGMLVRRDVWDRLGGFDPSLKLFRDDIDFCWRVQAAGLRVQVATDAVLYHRELSARRRRPTEGGNARLLDRRNALYVLALNLPLLTMLRVVGGCIVGSLIRATYFLLTKQLDLSASYAFSVLALFAHPVRLIRGRRRRAAGMAEGYTAVRLFIPPARTFSRLAEKIAGLIGNGPPQATYGRHQATVEESEEDEQFVDQQSVLRRVIGHPGVQLFIALLVIALVAERRLLGGNPLGGGALVPAWGGAAALWHEYLSGFHAVSVGSTASAPPYLAVVAMLATVLGGQAWLAVDVLLLGCVPLAGLTAYLATRWLVSATPARVLLAASYALLPVATGAVAAGRLGTAVAFILLPLIAVSAGRMLTAAPRQAHRAAWATGLLIAVAAAFAPLTWVLGLVLAIGAVAARRWLVAVSPVNAAIVAVTPFFVLFPWSLHLLSSPSAFLSEAGLSTTGLTTRGLSPTALLALSPGGPGVPPVWVTIGLGLGLVALVLPVRRTQLLIAGWAAAIVGILAAILVSRVSVTPATGGQPADGWPGVATALAALGLLLAAAPAAQWLATILQNGGGGLSSATASPGGYGRSRRLLAGVALAAAATAPLLVAAYWVHDGVRGPVSMITAPLLPAYVSASSTSGQQYRTLILRPDGGSLDYMVVRQGDPTLGEPELGTSAAAGAALSRQVAALGAPDGADAGDPGLVLGSFGIRWVLMPGPVSPVIAQRLDAALGLAALNKGPSYDLWQVTGRVARVSVVAADGTTTALSSGAVNASGVAAPASGGTLVLAEPYGGWTATLNGQALKPVATPVNGWAQGFVLPPGGGQLAITRDNLARVVSLFVELIAVLAVALLALPGKRVDPVKEAQALTALREARSGRRAATSARRAGRGVRAAGAGHRSAAGALGRLGLSGRRPVSPATDEESAGLVPAGQAAAALPPGAATDAASAAEFARAASARPRTALPVGLADRGPGDRGPADRGPGERGPDSRTGQAEDGGTAPWDMAGDWSPASGTAALDAWPADFPATGKAREDDGARAGTGPRESTGSREGSGSRESAGSWGTGPWEVTGSRDDATSRERSGPREGSESREGTGPWATAGFREGTGPWEVTGPRDDATSRERSESRGSAGSWGTTGFGESTGSWGTTEAWEDTGSWGNTESRGSAEPGEGTGPREATGPREGAASRESAGSRESGGFRGNTARRDDPVPLPGQRSSTPESPVLGTPVAETRPPWEAEPHRAPWESGPQAPVPAADPVSPAGTGPTTGGHRRLPWASAPANSRPAAPTAPQPAARTGAQPAIGTGPQPASRTGGPAAAGTPAEPIYWTGPQPVARTGEQPAARTGAQPVARTAAQPVARSDSQPAARTGGQPALGTGPQHVSWARPEPVTGTGGRSVSRTGGQPAGPSGPQPAARAPWESDDWDKAPVWDAITGQGEVAPAEPEPEPEPARGRGASGAAPAAGRQAKPERHSHRAAKHGKPSRWRGSGNRSGGDGES